jgi:hypothetical protein
MKSLKQEQNENEQEENNEMKQINEVNQQDQEKADSLAGNETGKSKVNVETGKSCPGRIDRNISQH